MSAKLLAPGKPASFLNLSNEFFAFWATGGTE
jgi:hypothetical protein